MGSARMDRRRAGVRHGFATVGLAVALALTGCGYDPSTAGNQEPPQGSAPSVDDADVSRQYAAHLVADAEQLLPVTERIQEDGAVSGPAKAVAGELRGILEMQTDRLDSDGGTSMITDEELQLVLGASGEQAEQAFVDLARPHVARMTAGWKDLVDAGDPDVAEVAGESVERLETLAEKLEQLPRN
ncbi:hypothetical protein [Corynebacterium freneyi]|uniref:hypothetical protein n=1 Tax=Corynebacterium freneyi TaxID=134034 RepID=UPI001CCC31CD|nr:hypothetical protein [Corynebacterium freneyi]MCG7438331.1 hypothetical protein [Corynebacterium freneyi]UBI01730.1 hypothetical protein LA334_09435 [Corynebacterium freneyi]